MPYRIAKNPRRRRHYIKEWREFRGLTQDQLADRLDTSKASLSRIETYKQPYTQDFLEACAEALLTEPVSLLIRDPSDDQSLWSIWDQAKPGERREIERAARDTVARRRTS